MVFVPSAQVGCQFTFPKASSHRQNKPIIGIAAYPHRLPFLLRFVISFDAPHSRQQPFSVSRMPSLMVCPDARASHPRTPLGCSEISSNRLTGLHPTAHASHYIPALRPQCSRCVQAAIALIFILACFACAMKAFPAHPSAARLYLPKNKNPAKSYVLPPSEIN